MASRYRPDRRGMAQLAAGAPMGAAMKEIAEQVGVPAFRAAAARFADSGEFADLVRVEPHRSDDGRAGAALVLYPDGDADPNAPVSIAFGTEDTPAHRESLQAAIDAIEGAGRG